jgi:hypothetical protein
MRGGVDSAAGAIKRGMQLVPFGIDAATGSPFLGRLDPTPLPNELPSHVSFGRGLHVGPSPSDGTIALLIQVDLRVLDETTGSAKPEKTAAR